MLKERRASIEKPRMIRVRGFSMFKGDGITPIYKRCDKCGRRLPLGTKCPCIKQRHKEYDNTRRNKHRAKIYGGKRWQDTREFVMEMYAGMDLYSYFVLHKIEPANTVHHIIPLEEDESKAYDVSDLIPLTNAHHQEIHKRMENGEHDEVIAELKELVDRYRKECERTTRI